MAMVAEIASSNPPALQRTDERHLMQSMKVLDANMPRRSTDVDSGAIRVATWARMFGHMPRQQIEFMCKQALVRHTFFPTIAEFQAIADEWQRADASSREIRLARAKFEQEQMHRCADARKLLRREIVDQSLIDGWPDWLRDHLVETGRLLRDDSGVCKQDLDWFKDVPDASDQEQAA